MDENKVENQKPELPEMAEPASLYEESSQEAETSHKTGPEAAGDLQEETEPPVQEKIALILVTYNRLSLLKEALEKIFALKEPLQIYIVDNASTDGTLEYLSSLSSDSKKELHILTMEENLGGAGGFFEGMKEAYLNGSDLFWLMDDDTMVDESSLKALLEARKMAPMARFYSSTALWTDGNPNKMNEQRLMVKDKGQPYLQAREATFVSLLVERKEVERIGFPIADFFIWGDDIEYTRRLTAKGFGLVVRDSRVVHKTASNTGSDISKDSKERLPRYYYAYRNEVFIARQEGIYRKLRQLAKILYHSALVLARAPQKKERLEMIWTSSKEGLDFDPEIVTVKDLDRKEN